MKDTNLIAIYAAIISTISIFWNIYSYFDNKKGRLKIIIDFETDWERNTEESYSMQVCNFLKVSFVNLTDKKRIISEIMIYVEWKN